VAEARDLDDAPVLESFAQSSPYVLHGGPAGFEIHDERGSFRYRVRIPAQPVWYGWETSHATPMAQVGVLQGTYLGIYINPVCEFWTTSLQCRFCTAGQNVGGVEAAAKTVEDVVETRRAAKELSGATFVHLNGGFQGGHALEFVEPFVRAIKQEVGMLVGVQLTPERQLSRYDRLIEMGVDHFSFCVELLDPEWFARICPGKARTLGQDLFFVAMEYCASRMPRGAVSGELIAGLEPTARTIEGIERITRAGAFPTVWHLSSHDRVRNGRLAAARLRRHAPGDGRHVRRVPSSPDPDRPRTEHRSQPRREPRRCGDAGAAERGLLCV
jgi:hypothetical protein